MPVLGFAAIQLDDATLATLGADGVRITDPETATRAAGNEILSQPQAIPALDQALDLDLAFQHGCARFEGGATKCWGRGDFGVLGVGTEGSTAVPVDVCF